MWYIWLIVAGACLTIEILTIGFLAFWFAIGALLAMLISFFIDNIIIQTVIFILSSSVLIPFTKPFVNKYINKPTKPTNSFSLINQHGIVLIDINPIQGVGQVKVNGEIWSAKCRENITIPKGTEIEVLQIDGVKLVVKPLKILSTN